jgi:hypothetical protein
MKSTVAGKEQFWCPKGWAKALRSGTEGRRWLLVLQPERRKEKGKIESREGGRGSGGWRLATEGQAVGGGEWLGVEGLVGGWGWDEDIEGRSKMLPPVLLLSLGVAVAVITVTGRWQNLNEGVVVEKDGQN